MRSKLFLPFFWRLELIICSYWETTLATNLRGVYNGLAAFYGMMKGGKEGGEKAIVLTGSKQG